MKIVFIFLMSFLFMSAQAQHDSVVKYRNLSTKYMRLSEHFHNDTSMERKYYDTSRHYISIYQSYFRNEDESYMKKRRDSIANKIKKS